MLKSLNSPSVEENTKYKAIVIGGSAGSFQVMVKILSEISNTMDLPIILCLHRLKHIRNGFVEALQIKSRKKIIEPEDKESLKKGNVYLAPSNYHLSLELGNKFALSTEDMVNNSRPSIDLTIQSSSYVFKDKIIGIMLSGANKDGALGMSILKKRGGFCIVQDPLESTINTMPNAAIEQANPDRILNTDGIIKLLNSLKLS